MSDLFSLEGRTALVTGAGRGIGRGCALALAEAGADIVAVSRTEADLDSLALDVRRVGRRAVATPCDVTDSPLLRTVIGGLPRLDVLVVCAGMNRPAPLVDVDDHDLDAVIGLNLRAAFVTLQAGARRMVAAKGGSIILVSSQMGHVGAVGRSVYCATKHAVEGMAKAAALELAQHGIRVNTLAPTFIETGMTAPFLADDDFARDVRARIPLGRIGAVRDLAGAVVFLASDAAGFVTGTSLIVDGGWTAQ